MTAKETDERKGWNNYQFLLEEKWCPLPAVKVKKQSPKLKDFTKKLIKSLTPSIPESEFRGGIKLKCGTVISRPGYGKTELCKQICKEVIKHYGEENVNPLTGKYLAALIANFDEKPVQFLVVDDSTSLDKKTQREAITHYVTIRHDLKKLQEKLGKEKRGVIDVIFSSHSFYMLDKQIRTLFNFTIMKSSDSNQHNRRVIIEEFGYPALQKLDQITKRKELHDDISVLSESIISMLGEQTGGYLKFEYDAEEAAIIPWRVIEVEDFLVDNSSHKLNKILPSEGFWGNFSSIMGEELIRKYSEIEQVCGFTSKDNMLDCLKLWFSKFFLGKSEEALLELRIVDESSIKPYLSRVNKFFNSFDTRQYQKTVSERWVIEGLSQIKPLSPLALCVAHRFANQPSDVCLHDLSGEHLLSINVKWYADNRADTNKLSADPEWRIPPAALLFIGSSRRKNHPTAHLRFALLAAEEKDRRIRDLPLIALAEEGGEEKERGEETRGQKDPQAGEREREREREKDNGFILQVVADQIIERLVESPGKKKQRKKQEKKQLPGHKSNVIK